jgi:predicted metal-binding transcription factor (methanogenesis marker protein 9)
MADSDSDTPLFGPERGRKRAADSDDDIPLFGPMSRPAKMQKPCPPEDYLKEVAGLSQEELNAGAVDEAELRLGVAESLASTPSKNELEVSQSFSKQEDVDREDAARKAAAEMTSFGKGTLKIRM